MSELTETGSSPEQARNTQAIWLTSAWAETAPYSGQWVHRREYVRAGDAASAAEITPVVPGFGNSLSVIEAYTDYQDKVAEDFEKLSRLVAGIELMSEADDPAANEHRVYAALCDVMDQARATQAWLEKFGGTQPIPDPVYVGVTDSERWRAVRTAVANMEDQLDHQAASPHVQLVAVGELYHHADVAALAISQGGDGEFRPCNERNAQHHDRAVWKIVPAGEHDRRRDNDIFCSRDAQIMVDGLDKAGQPIVMTQLLKADEPKQPSWLEPITRSYRNPDDYEPTLF